MSLHQIERGRDTDIRVGSEVKALDRLKDYRRATGGRAAGCNDAEVTERRQPSPE